MAKYLSNEEKLGHLKTPADLENPYFKEDYFSRMEEFFYEFKGELVDRIEQLETEKKDIMPQNKTEVKSAITSYTQLPIISLPKFSGDYNEWVSFRDLFLSVIDSNGNLADVQKLHHLKVNLVGEAAQVIKQFNITNANYRSAWTALSNRHENARALITSQIKLLISQPKISNESASSIKSLIDVTCECLASLQNLKVNTVNWDPLLIYLLVQKLPPDTHRAWEESLSDCKEFPTWMMLQKFLELRFRTLEAIGDGKSKTISSPSKTPHSSNSKIQSFHATQVSCKVCNDNHSLRLCNKFLKMNVKSRSDVVRTKGYCFNCLGHNHLMSKCLSSQTCSKCKKKHHTLLHQSHVNDTKRVSTSTENIIESTTQNVPSELGKHSALASTSKVLNHFISENRHVLLATAIVHIVTPHGPQIVRALIDPGSQATFITEAAVRRMRIPMSHTAVRITGLGKSETAKSHKMVKFLIQPQIEGYVDIKANAIVLDVLTDLLPTREIITKNWEHHRDLTLADPLFYRPNKIDIIIGADLYPFILLDGVRKGPADTPIAQNTIFGWVLLGLILNQRAKTNEPEIVSFINTYDVHNQLKMFWELKEVQKPMKLKPEDELCENIYQNTHSRKVDGTYVVRLPFKNREDIGNILGSSRNTALNRFITSERSLQRKTCLKEYNQVLDEYLISGHMKEIAAYEKQSFDFIPNSDITNNCYYFPHHAVIKPSSTTTKLRVVFDASCKTSSGRSLNDELLVGPILQNDIISLLMRWRHHKYVFTADIEKMHSQIWVHPDDVNFQRII